MIPYNIPISTEITVSSGVSGPIFYYENLTSGMVVVREIDAYSHNADCSIITKTNLTRYTVLRDANIISSLIPTSTASSPVISGFMARSWNGTGNMAGISGITGGREVSVALASNDSNVASLHTQGGLRIGPGGNFAVSVRNFEGPYAKVVLNVQLQLDLRTNAPTYVDAATGQEPASKQPAAAGTSDEGGGD
tara:strand:- start:177 stop:755 length:579 start_codon:yes stop_codon:yes gene_type:complete